MKLVTTLAIYDHTGRLTELEGYLYDGPVAECKKGRETQEANQNYAASTAKNYGNLQTGYRGKGDSIANNLVSAPGQMSTYAKANYNASLRNNAQAANNERQQGFSTIARRGFGSVPVGAGSSITNTANRDNMAADTSAYTKAMDDTLNHNLTALNYFTGQQQEYNPANMVNAASNAAQVRSQMGSTFGDIMSGIQGLGSTFGDIATGGGSRGFGLWGKK